ncbi:IGR protein motif-domain-containing protein [Phycomyces nitens]|nr:IGR protein motif-domain-containing protein [Phycomyces nitens]
MFSIVRTPFIRSVRSLHTATGRVAAIPEPRGKATDVEGFLKAIGRGCEENAGKFESWEKLFTADSRTMKNDGISVKQRKYILGWLEQYRQGKDVYPIAVPSPKKKK